MLLSYVVKITPHTIRPLDVHNQEKYTKSYFDTYRAYRKFDKYLLASTKLYCISFEKAYYR